ncbi:MAG: hypothetical protein HPY81_11055 [Firmicutes bacterium]|nr:hypothetical protein [Bacillota bacterium]
MIRFVTREFNGKTGLALVISDATASLQDLLDAIQPFSDDSTIYKEYLIDQHGTCRGCRINCCRQSFVIPDRVSFNNLINYFRLSPVEFLARYADPHKLSYGLPRFRSGPCVFLKDAMCTIYPYRPLICQLYLCTPMDGDTGELIYSVVSAGIAELIRYGQEQGFLPAWSTSSASSCGLPSQGSPTGYDRMFIKIIERWADNSSNPFCQVNSYTEIRLRDVCPPETWLRLVQT